MRRGVERLRNVEGQDAILLLPTNKARNTGAAAVEPGMAPNCQSAASPLRARTPVNLRMRGFMSIRMSCCPSAMGLYSSTFPVAVPLGISQIMASC